MTIERLEVLGYKCFSTKQSINFAIPNSEPGSGITYLTGGNNSGKSSIIEILRARNGYDAPSFPIENRNSDCDEVEISYVVNGKTETIKSIRKGLPDTNWTYPSDYPHIFIVPSRRAFVPHFKRMHISRLEYVKQSRLTLLRPLTLERFPERLFKIHENPTYFNELLEEVIGYLPNWSIDFSSNGTHFLKFGHRNYFHNSDGIGEGIISIFVIIDALYDSDPDETIVIDEPELSLHPSLQKRLFNLLKKFSSDRQIVIATHSPYFIDPITILRGATLARVIATDKGTEIRQITQKSVEALKRIATKNLYNPHVFGLNSREIFFQEDGIIVVEGQEDVVCFPEIENQLGINFAGTFFGWGAGGADRIEHVCTLLNDLGFRKVVGILDADKKTDIPKLEQLFPAFRFFNIPADDIRFKKEELRKEKEGILDSKNIILEKFRADTQSLIEDVNAYLTT